MAVVTTPTLSLNVNTECSDSLAGVEAELLGGMWDDALLPDFDGYSLPPGPLNDLLCHGPLEYDPTWSTDPAYHMYQPQTSVLHDL